GRAEAGAKLGADLLPIEGPDAGIEPGSIAETKDSDLLEEIQRQHILQVLERTAWVISGPNGAGAILDLDANTLRSLMHRLEFGVRCKLLCRRHWSGVCHSNSSTASIADRS